MDHLPLISLAAAWPSQVVVVVAVDVPNDDSARLKALGICVGRKVQIVKRGDPLIVRVVGTRIGLSGRLAESVQVRPVAGASEVTSIAG